jgi:hypothetical protein
MPATMLMDDRKNLLSGTWGVGGMGASSLPVGMIAQMPNAARPLISANLILAAHCVIKFENCQGGIKMTCTGTGQVACIRMQNLCSILVGGMFSCCAVMNGMMVYCCNMTRCKCECDMTADGCVMTFTTGDPKSCEMIQACCECIGNLMRAGCLCCMMINGTPVCCGSTSDRAKAAVLPAAGASIKQGDQQVPEAKSEASSAENVQGRTFKSADTDSGVSPAADLSIVSQTMASKPDPSTPVDHSPDKTTLPAALGCVIEAFHDGFASCLVSVAGSTLPVDFPADALRSRGLREQMQFEWSVPADGAIRASDIRPIDPDATDALREKYLQHLLEEDEADVKSGVWLNIRDD